MKKSDKERNGYGYGDSTATDKEKIKDLVGRIEEALDLCECILLFK